MVEKEKVYNVHFYGHLTQFWVEPLYNKYVNEDDVLKGNYENCIFPIIFLSKDSEYMKNKRMTDFLNTDGLAHKFIVTDKVLEVLSSNNITGWKTYPVEIYDKNENYIGGYHGLSIIGRCEAVKPSLAEPWINSYGEKVLKGLPLDLDTWDGSDVFLLQGTSRVFVTARAKKIIEKNKLTNIYFEDIADSIVPLYHIFENRPFWEHNKNIIISE